MCPPRGVEVLSMFAVLDRPLAAHVPTYRTRNRARIEVHAEDSDQRVSDEKHCRRFVPAA